MEQSRTRRVVWYQQEEWGEVAELNQLEQVMRQPDAVMEPGILVKLQQYVAKGGSPRDVVEMLTDSYVGRPDLHPQKRSPYWRLASKLKVHIA